MHAQSDSPGVPQCGPINKPSFCAKSRRAPRRGVAAVELALILPLFVILLFGVTEVSELLDLQNELAVAVREGARVAAADRSEIFAAEQTTNQRMIQEVISVLESNGVPTDQVTVQIVNSTDHTTPIDLDLAANNSTLFELRAEVPYSAVTALGSTAYADMVLSATAVFRNSYPVVDP